VRDADIDATTTVGTADGAGAAAAQCVRRRVPPDRLGGRARRNCSRASTLKMAALEGDVARGKVEAGQSAGLIDDIVPAGELVAPPDARVRRRGGARARAAAAEG
jgi:enoyl-[acyl-carrier protein] reductase II